MKEGLDKHEVTYHFPELDSHNWHCMKQRGLFMYQYGVVKRMFAFIK